MIANKRVVHQGRSLQAGLTVVLGVLIGLAACASTARAQGSRKDDIVFNAQGRPMAGATVRICTSAATGQPCTPLAQIYSDPGLTQALANPTTTDGLGNYSFYASPARYMVEISGPGITTKQIPNVILPSDPSSPTFTTVTTTSGISAFSLSLTGNLTVNGSAAVVGSLTVGGAAVPSVAQDNIWTNSQRNKGPIPYVDFTAFMPAGGCSSALSFTTPTATMSSGSAAVTFSSAQDFKNGCGIMVEGAGATSSLTAPSAPTVASHITGGSTTIKYAVVWVDNNEGYSAASTTTSFTTSDTYANLTLHHYNYVTVTSAPTAALLGCVYSDKGTGGPLIGIGCAPTAASGGNVQFGFQDWGQVLPLPAFLPANPPGAAGPQALFTTISSGGGTTTLTLATNALNSVAGTKAFHDESQFLYNAWVQAQSTAGWAYVFIPSGLYYFGHIVPFASFAVQMHVKQVGDVYLDDFPLFFGQNNFQMYWDGALGAHNPQQFAVWPTAWIVSNNNIPQVVVSNNNFWLANVEIRNVQGDAAYATGGGSGFRFEQFSVVGNSAQKGCAIRSDGNVIGAYVEHFVFSGSAQQNDPGTICFNNLTQNVGTQGWMIRDGWVDNHFVQFDSPSNLMNNLCFQNLSMDWIQSESMWDRGILNVDSGSGTQSCAGQGIVIGPSIVQDSNRLGSTGYFTVWCINLVQNACVSNGVLNNQQSAGTIGYSNSAEATLSTNFNLTQVSTGYHRGSGQGFDVSAGGATMPRGGNVTIGTTGVIASNTGGACDSYASNCVLSAQILPPPQFNGSLSAASGGSMAAGQYCYEVSSLDASGGESVVGLEQCITVILNQQVTIPLIDLMSFGARCYRVYRTAANGGSGNENVYLNIQGACGGSSVNPPPFFTTTVLDTGSLTYTSATPKTNYSNAYMSALNFGAPIWLAAGNNGNPNMPVGIGTTCTAAENGAGKDCLTLGIKTDVKGGLLRAQGGTLTTKLNGVLFASQQAGADACAQIQTAITALTSTGGRIIEDISGNQTCAGGFHLTAGITLECTTAGISILTVGAPVQVDYGALLVGCGGSQSSNQGFVIRAANNLNGPPLIIGNTGSSTGHWLQVRNVSVDGNKANNTSAADCIAIYPLGEAAVIEAVTVNHCAGWGYHVQRQAGYCGESGSHTLGPFTANDANLGGFFMDQICGMMNVGMIHCSAASGNTGPCIEVKAASGQANLMVQNMQIEGGSVSGAFEPAILTDGTTSNAHITIWGGSESSVVGGTNFIKHQNGCGGCTPDLIVAHFQLTGTDYVNLYNDTVNGGIITMASVADVSLTNMIHFWVHDINGMTLTSSLNLGRRNKALVNGANQNVVLDSGGTGNYIPSFATFTGPTAAFSTGGFFNNTGTNTTEGRLLIACNLSTQIWTVNNEDAGSTAANRIRTATGANVVLGAGPSCAQFMYEGADSRWVMTYPNGAPAGCISSCYWYPFFNAPVWFDNGGVWQASQTGGAANRPFLMRSYQPVGNYVTTITFRIATGSAGGHMDVGIYSGSGSLLAHTGSVATDTTGNKATTITQTLIPAGTYFFAWCADNTTVQANAAAFGSTSALNLFTNNANYYGWDSTDTQCSTGVLPSSITPSNITNSTATNAPYATFSN